MASRKSITKSASRRPQTARRPARKKAPTTRAPKPAARVRKPAARVRKWSGAVSKTSDALDLAPGVFTSQSARRIALSLKRSAQTSRRRKSSPFQSAMSMLNFEINRGGRGLSEARRQVLNRAKIELRKAFGRG